MEPNKENMEMIKEFVDHCVEELGIKGEVNIKLLLTAQGIPTAGSYDSENGVIRVSIKNRAVADCMRTIAHELTHQKQKESGVIFPESDEELQKYEDEANSTSGKLTRFWGRKHRQIYSDLV